MPLSHSTETFPNEQLATLRGLQTIVSAEPYSIEHRIQLAKAYKILGYPDLAAGDAYKALLLADEIAEEGEYHDEALAAAVSDMTLGGTHSLETYALPDMDDDESRVMVWIKTYGSKLAYDILITSLVDCGCLRSAFDFTNRALRAFSNDALFRSHREMLLSKLSSHFKLHDENCSDINFGDYPDKGVVRRELYPWNNHEPNRYSIATIQTLNEEMSRIGPKLEVKVAELPMLSNDADVSDQKTQFVKQLGVFAKEDIPPGTVVLKEKSILTAISRLHDTYCDACSVKLPIAASSPPDPLSDDAPRACEDCGEVFFCSTECEELAQRNYHPSICGVNMEQKVPASEAADFLYTLLLVRALALAKTRDIHPLDLPEVRYIWGDYHGLDLEQHLRTDFSAPLVDPFESLPKTLPFSFNANILTPLHMLEKMDVNIFEQSGRYDTWIFNTLYAKFRGTASAQQGLDGRPEIGAVHPMWCLANHSCDPNVTWEWQGSIKFWTKEQLVDWKGRDKADRPGLRKGEEVLSHYCDIRLPVKDRREWAVGALGGHCMCRRCIWEDAQEAPGSEKKQDIQSIISTYLYSL